MHNLGRYNIVTYYKVFSISRIASPKHSVPRVQKAPTKFRHSYGWWHGKSLWHRHSPKTWAAGTSVCCVYTNTQEYIEHIIVNCPYVKAIWDFFLSMRIGVFVEPSWSSTSVIFGLLRDRGYWRFFYIILPLGRYYATSSWNSRILEIILALYFHYYHTENDITFWTGTY